MPFPFAFTRLNALQAAVRHSHTDNIMVAHYNMNQVVIFLTSTIGHMHNILIKPAQNNSSDTVAMGVTANLGAKHGRKCRRKSDGDNI